jgi:hypothetical protein
MITGIKYLGIRCNAGILFDDVVDKYFYESVQDIICIFYCIDDRK